MPGMFMKPVVGAGFPRDGFEFDFPGRAFQMVPVGGERPFAVATDEKDWLMSSSTPGVLRLKDFKGGIVRNPPGNMSQLIMPRRSFITFTLHGEANGATTLILQDESFRISHSLRVSVKEKLVKKFAVRMLRDLRRSTARTKDDALAILGSVGSLFVEQANIDLQQVGVPADILVQKDLGNPVFLDLQMNDIVAATPAVQTDLWIYCAWNVEDSRKPNQVAIGLTGSGRSFLDDGPGFGSDFATQQFGHEIGHALGLDHHAANDHLMFFAKSGGLRLGESEINKLNPSGRSDT